MRNIYITIITFLIVFGVSGFLTSKETYFLAHPTDGKNEVSKKVFNGFPASFKMTETSYHLELALIISALASGLVLSIFSIKKELSIKSKSIKKENNPKIPKMTRSERLKATAFMNVMEKRKKAK